MVSVQCISELPVSAQLELVKGYSLADFLLMFHLTVTSPSPPDVLQLKLTVSPYSTGALVHGDINEGSVTLTCSEKVLLLHPYLCSWIMQLRTLLYMHANEW